MSVTLLPVAPSATDGASTFPTVARDFFTALRTMVTEVNATGLGTLSQIAGQPQDGSSSFVSGADDFVGTLPGLRTEVNTLITALSLACSAISALPATPSRTSDPTNFETEGPAFLAALTTMRTELNAFITALNDSGALMISGDMTDGDDLLLLSGDMQSGTDKLRLSGSF